MPNYKQAFPRQSDYDDDYRSLLSRLIRLESGVSAALAAATAAASSTATVVQQTTVISGGGGGGATGFISLTVPAYQSVSGSPVNLGVGGGFTVSDTGSGVTAGTYTAPIVTFDVYGRATFATASGITGGGGGGGTAGVQSVNSLTGNLTLYAGANITTATVGATGIQLSVSLTAAGGGTGSVSAGWWNVYNFLVPPSTADTTWLNQGAGNTAASLTPILDTTGRTAGLYLLGPPDGNVGTNPGNLRLRVTAKPVSATWTATIAFEPVWRSTQYPAVGMVYASTAGTAYQVFHLLQNAGALAFEVVNYTGFASFGAPTVPFTESHCLLAPLCFMRLRQSTGTLNFEMSADGYDWLWLTGWTTGQFVTAASHIGYFANSRNANPGRTAAMTIWHWKVDQQ